MVDYDLHIHSSASDGLLSAKEIFQIAKKLGLKGLAITDHDTVKALSECVLLAKTYEMDFIPGIEISTYFKDYEIHVLGYFIDYTNLELLNFLRLMQQTREDRNKKMILLLQENGYEVNYEEIAKGLVNNKSIGRPHIARKLVEKGYFKSVKDVFDKLLGAGKPAYVNREKIGIDEAAEIITKAGGIPIAAHPLINKKFNQSIDFDSYIRMCVNLGVNGIEVFHTEQNEEQENFLYETAKKYKLAVTGGSDCHGELIEGAYLLGSKGISSKEMYELKKLKR